MMASVDEGVGMLFETLERQGQLDDTFIVFLGDNGYFFGEHGLGPERRFAYEEGIRSPFVVRYPPRVKAGTGSTRAGDLQDIAPTLDRARRRQAGPAGPGALAAALSSRASAPGWRKSFLVEYWAENAMPWLVGMTYKAVRTDRYKYIHWVNRGATASSTSSTTSTAIRTSSRNVNRRRAYAPRATSCGASCGSSSRTRSDCRALRATVAPIAAAVRPCQLTRRIAPAILRSLVALDLLWIVRRSLRL